MSNSLNANPVIINQPMASSYKTSTLNSLGAFQSLIVRKTLWQSPTNQGDTVLIIGPSGQELVRLIASAAKTGQNIDFFPPKLWADFQIVQIDSGDLEIHFV